MSSRIQLKKTGKNYSACCPFHKEKTPSFTVSPDKQFYYCFGCGAGGNALGFVMDHDQLEFPRRSRNWQACRHGRAARGTRRTRAHAAPADRLAALSAASAPPPSSTSRR
ncbi:CHC2 zinc finger domain-containing protein [Pseudomonas aeruginosa]